MICKAVLRTIPSVGKSSVERVKYAKLSEDSCTIESEELPDKSCRFWVLTVLDSSITPFEFPALNSVKSILTPCPPSEVIWESPLLEKLLFNDVCHAELTHGTGNHTRVLELGGAISTRVVTSKVLQLPGVGVKVLSGLICAAAKALLF